MIPFQLGEARTTRAAALYEAAKSELLRMAPDYLDRFPLDPYIAELNHHGRIHRYWDVSSRDRELTDGMSAAYPSPAVELYNRMLLAYLILTSGARNQHNITESVTGFVFEDFDRILSGLERPRAAYYLRSVYLFRRDLAIARLKVIPAGAEFIDINVGVPRRDLTRKGVRGFVNFARVFQLDIASGLSPLYEPHWDRRYIRHFSAVGYDAFHRRTADLLRANPEIKGIYGRSWWFDPAVSEISPEMAFLRGQAESGGARFAYLHEPENPYLKTDPFAGSPKRKALHEAGQYTPRTFMMFWPRANLLKWAASTPPAQVAARPQAAEALKKA